MSHQVIITFDIDENKVQENAEKEAGRQVAREVIDSAFGRSYSKERLMKEYVEKAIEHMLAPHKEEIIAEAVKSVTCNLHRTKAVKDLLERAQRGET